MFKVNVESKKERLGERSLSSISLLLLIYIPYASSCTFTQDDFIWIDNWNIKKVTTVFAHCEASITAACHPLLSSLLSWAVWMQYKETKLALSFVTTVLKSTIHNHAQFPSLKAIQQLLASPFSLVACKKNALVQILCWLSVVISEPSLQPQADYLVQKCSVSNRSWGNWQLCEGRRPRFRRTKPRLSIELFCNLLRHTVRGLVSQTISLTSTLATNSQNTPFAQLKW